MSDYPSSLPLPQVADYGVQAALGVTAVTFEAGNRRQRRGAGRERHTFSLLFMFTSTQFSTWQFWANGSGFDWHQVNLISTFSGLAGTDGPIPHYVRYISDFDISLIGGIYYQVKVAAELDLDRPPSGDIIPSGNWYVAGTPAAPAANTITAGTPAAPATNTITAGTPAVPAA